MANFKKTIILIASLFLLSSCGTITSSEDSFNSHTTSIISTNGTSIDSNTSKEENSTSETSSNENDDTSLTSNNSSNEQESTSTIDSIVRLTSYNLWSANNFTLDNLSLNDELEAGCKFTLNLKQLKTDFYFNPNTCKNIYIILNGSVYQPNMSSSTTSLTNIDVDVIIPNEDFYIALFYNESTVIESGYLLKIIESENIDIIGIDISKKFDFLNFIVISKNNTLISSIDYKIGDDEFKTLINNPRNGFSYTKANGRSDVVKIKIYPNNENITDDVFIKINTISDEKFQIFYTGDLSYLKNYSNFVKESISGQTIMLDLSINTSGLIKILSDDVTFSDYANYKTFIMPNKNVTINFKYIVDDVSLNITNNEYIASYKFLLKNDYYGESGVLRGCKGELIYLYIATKNGHKPVNAQYDDNTFSFNAFGKDDDENYIYYTEILINSDTTSIILDVTILDAFKVDVNEDINCLLLGGYLYFESEIVYTKIENMAENLSLKLIDSDTNEDITSSIDQNLYYQDSRLIGIYFIMTSRNILIENIIAL